MPLYIGINGMIFDRCKNRIIVIRRESNKFNIPTYVHNVRIYYYDNNNNNNLSIRSIPIAVAIHMDLRAYWTRTMWLRRTGLLQYLGRISYT